MLSDSKSGRLSSERSRRTPKSLILPIIERAVEACECSQFLACMGNVASSCCLRSHASLMPPVSRRTPRNHTEDRAYSLIPYGRCPEEIVIVLGVNPVLADNAAMASLGNAIC